MIAAPDSSVRCGCGRATYSVAGYFGRRTCAGCGYLTSSCRCGAGLGSTTTARASPRVSDKVRAFVGAGVIAISSAVFALAFVSSPFVAFFGFGVPLVMSCSFFVQWLRSREDYLASVEPAPRTRAGSKAANR